MATETLYLASGVSGNAATPDNAIGASDGVWTTNGGNDDWTHRWRFSGFPSGPVEFESALALGVLARKSASGGGDPEISAVRLYQDGAQIAEWTNVTSPDANGGWREHSLSTSALSGLGDVDVEIVTSGRGGGPNQRTVQIDAARLVFDYRVLQATTLHAWDGAVWQSGALRRWDGAAWRDATLKMWNGSAWVNMG